MTETVAPRLALCPPDHFAVVYAINPWMDPGRWGQGAEALKVQARAEWQGFKNALIAAGAEIDLVKPEPGLPDMVFTANAAVVLDRKALVARFRWPERQGEEAHFLAYFRGLVARGLLDHAEMLPQGMTQEGAGDCIWDASRGLFWAGHGPRSSLSAAAHAAEFFGVPVVPLELVSQRFYHMDVCLCPLPGGEILCHAPAFSAASYGRLREEAGRDKLIDVDAEDAAGFAANAVAIGNKVIMSACGDDLRARMAERGYEAVVVPLEAFRMAGGAAFCLTLRLNHMSDVAAKGERKRA